MEQSTSSSFLSTLFTGYEIEIADVLLHLPNLIYEPKSPYRFSVNWMSKRRRSAINSSPYQSPSVQVKRETDEGRPRIKAEASSPATPLSFSPSESDGKSKDSIKKVSNKREREEWIGIIDGLVQQRELLRGEIETVKSYFNKLQAVNWELKAKKKELQFYLGNPHLEKSLNLGMKLNQPIMQSPMIQNQDHPQIHSMIHRQPFILDWTAYKSSSDTSRNLQYRHGQMPQLKVKSVGPLGIPDLNVAAAEETFGVDAPQPLDRFRALTESRAKAAEARRRRMIRIKEMKNSLATIKPQ
ncbi:hypothetical protein RHGRI_015938 [Rhododendron griersonianum]|uniref:Uncharacterized protein n=1 Tax=Rhododendron griersonianum TaxID=479676 RepID=A0AAV6JP50_9ERIC|nr:hypothetical protein RHGRI_015938 [Rhododendron griersonianum]